MLKGRMKKQNNSHEESLEVVACFNPAPRKNENAVFIHPGNRKFFIGQTPMDAPHHPIPGTEVRQVTALEAARFYFECQGQEGCIDGHSIPEFMAVLGKMV